ncbi:MAG: hypothetical protein EHM35_15655, partial [Planctomycetaceae bacterium]
TTTITSAPTMLFDVFISVLLSEFQNVHTLCAERFMVPHVVSQAGFAACFVLQCAAENNSYTNCIGKHTQVQERSQVFFVHYRYGLVHLHFGGDFCCLGLEMRLTLCCPMTYCLRWSRVAIKGGPDPMQITSRGCRPITLVAILICLTAVPCVRGDSLVRENSAISVSLDAADGTMTILDKRTGERWVQKAVVRGTMAETTIGAHGITGLWRVSGFSVDTSMQIELDGDKPEFTVTLSAQRDMTSPLRYPLPFVTQAGTCLVIPMNEGISYPVDDASVGTQRLIAYGGHGICMPFWGATDGQRGYMAILETPDDAAILIARHDGKLCIMPEWDPQKGQFGYARKVRYVFLDKGGHVAMCKRYRSYARQTGLLKTLTDKRAVNPNVDLLIGAVNVWYRGKEPLGMVRDMKSRGIDRILWSNRASPEIIQAMNDLGGVLTSRYDIYQDLMDPNVVKEQLRSVHPDWTQAAWPADIMLDQRGDRRKGWEVRGKDGKMYPCAVLCDKQAVKYAAERVPAELKTHPYRCRFIDTTTAAPWRECYHPDHPMTRGESRRWKMELLRYMSQDVRLVTGSETGHDAAVPFVHYFEGMLSL